MNKLRLSKTFIVCTIILIAAFQCYWINSLYNTEWQTLKKETDVLFRDVVYKLQVQRFRDDTSLFREPIPDNLFVLDVIDSVKKKFIDSALKHNAPGKEKIVTIKIDRNHLKDTTGEKIATFRQSIDSFDLPLQVHDDGSPRIIKYFSENKSLNEPLSLKGIDSAYKTELIKNGISIGFIVSNFTGKEDELKNNIAPDELKTNFTFVGLTQAQAYQASFENPFTYILGKIRLQVLFSVLLIAITIASFIFLYRNLRAQQKLAQVKNEFISNVTHELKTPIATVNVAIEALRNFNAIKDPEKTKEYLDISASELQRLSLLVDNVLKLSMFENKEIELKKENFDLYQLAEEIIATMKLQFEKAHAAVTLTREGDRFNIEADRLHITSVIYNLVDNALKYSIENPEISVKIISHPDFIEICVSDNGIGIADEYRQKVFDKFFRVPSESHHNIKGYGLGLSYVSHIAKRHHGFIEMQSKPGKGSTFSIKLPYHEADEINYGGGRVVKKKKLKL